MIAFVLRQWLTKPKPSTMWPPENVLANSVVARMVLMENMSLIPLLWELCLVMRKQCLPSPGFLTALHQPFYPEGALHADANFALLYCFV